MCDDDKFSKSNQFEHFAFHARKVQEQISQLHRGIGEASIQSITQHAESAVDLADSGVPRECKDRLSKIALGEVVLSPEITAA